MPHDVLTEEPLHFGEGGRLFGILTLPNVAPHNAQELPVFVFLSAGLLHRVGPGRLYVSIARELARMGFTSLRVDLSGTGDSPPRPALTNQQSVAADYQSIVGTLQSRLGGGPLVLVGLCSGADNAIRLAVREPRVVGMVLLDPICYPDYGFKARAFFAKYMNPARYIGALKRRLKAVNTEARQQWKGIDVLSLRDLPNREELRAAFEAIRDRGGQVLSVFTQYAFYRYYNQKGQLRRVIGVEGYPKFCTELFWPQADHTYPLELHRRRLIEEVKTWAAGYIRS